MGGWILCAIFDISLQSFTVIVMIVFIQIFLTNFTKSKLKILLKTNFLNTYVYLVTFYYCLCLFASTAASCIVFTILQCLCFWKTNEKGATLPLLLLHDYIFGTSTLSALKNITFYFWNPIFSNLRAIS